VLKEIKKEELKDWEYGDVCLKTFSYGEQLSLAELKKGVDDESVIDVKKAGLMTVAAGIKFIRGKDGVSFFIKPTDTLDDKMKLVYDFDGEHAKCLLKVIKELNAPISREEKKN